MRSGDDASGKAERGSGTGGGALARRLLSHLALTCLLWTGGPAAAEDVEPDGFRYQPSLGWKRGDQRIDLALEHRYRYESWKSRSSTRDGIHGLRSRLGVAWSWRDTVRLFAQGQHVAVYSLAPDTSGAGAAYRANTPGGDDSHTDDLKIRQLYLDLRGMETLLRAGRQDIAMGGTVLYADPDWSYLKGNRLSQRLVGTVGWSNVERSYDGLSGRSDAIDGHHVHAFAAQPTTGVFDVPGAYERQKDITFGGLEWTVKRDAWLANTELTAFGLVYEDGRPSSKGGRTGDVEVYTLGASLLGVYPLGPGRLDVVLWGAFQSGDFSTTTAADPQAVTLDHLAGAGIVEAGYRLPEIFARPWLRVGVNVASGDGDPGDQDHETFFNLLPTNHPYYGYADQVAFQNIVDTFVQLMLEPHSRIGIEITWHWFALASRDDEKYSGSGAYNQDTFGYAGVPSRGQRDVGHELDVVGTFSLHRHVQLKAGYAHLFGGDVLAGPETRDTEWAFAQLLLTY